MAPAAASGCEGVEPQEAEQPGTVAAAMHCDPGSQTAPASTAQNVGDFGMAYYGAGGTIRKPANASACTGVLIACDTVLTSDCGFGDNSVRCSAGTRNAGEPQVCQICGCDDGDSDGDGACDSEDPCLNVKSSQTVNTNLVSERVHTPDKLWPDVCDPVPSPAVAPVVEEAVIEDLGCPNVHCYKAVRRTRNRMEVTPVRSNASPELPSTNFPPALAPRAVNTHPRFCPTEGAYGDRCLVPSSVNDQRLTDATSRDAELEAQPYHRVRFSYRVAPGIPWGASLFSALIPAYPMPLDSCSRANTTTAVVLAADATAVLDRVTQREDGSLVGGGDDLGVACGAGTVLVECAAGVRCAIPCDGVRGNDPGAPGAADESCHLVAGPESEGLTDESDFACRRLGDPPGPCAAGQLACASSCFVPCDGSIGCEPNGQFSDEQPDLCGSLEGGPGGGGDSGGGAGGGSGAGGGLLVPALPVRRTGYAAVYSRTLDRVFLAGGTTDTGAQAGDLWLGAPRGHFSRMAPEGTFGTVLGITYSPRERAVFVLDERPGEWGTTRAHLTRVDAATGARSALGSWVRAGLYAELHLVADNDGSLLLAGSSRARDRHVLVRIDPARRRVTRIVPGAHALAAPPVVDEAGYLLVTQRRDGRIVYRHPRELGPGAGCPWARLGWQL